MSKLRIFLSHARADQKWARALADALCSRGAEVWLDVEQLAPGDPYVEALEEALRGSDMIVLILTQENMLHPNVLFELGVALGLGKRVVPVISKEVEVSRLPSPLRVRRSLTRESPNETAKQLLEGTAA